MNRRSQHRTTMRLVVSWILIALLPVWQVQAQQQAPHLSKHGKKIHKVLSKYPSGSFLHLFLRDGTDVFGNLGTVSHTAFEFTNANTAVTTSISYEDVDRVTPGAPSIAAGTRGNRRQHGKVGLLVIIGVATAVAVGIIAASRD